MIVVYVMLILAGLVISALIFVAGAVALALHMYSRMIKQLRKEGFYD